MEDVRDEVEYPEVNNNPAARLRVWLDAAQERARITQADLAASQRSGQGRTVPSRMLSVWCDIWDLDEQDRADRIEYQRRATGMIDAGVEVRRLATASTNFMAPSAVEHFGEVESALNVFMDGPDHDINTMMSRIQPTGWHSLKALDHLLSNEAPQPTLRGDQIGDLVRQVQDLIRSIAKAKDLSADDRLLLTEKLNEVEVALTRASITGTVDVLRATDSLMGGLMRLAMRGVDVTNHPLAHAIWGLIGSIVTLIGVGADLTTLQAGPWGGLLGLPSGPATSPKK